MLHKYRSIFIQNQKYCFPALEFALWLTKFGGSKRNIPLKKNLIALSVQTFYIFFFKYFCTRRESQIYGLLKSRKKIGDSGAFVLEIIKKHLFQKAVKYKATYGVVVVFFSNGNFPISLKCMITPNFLLGYQEHLLSSAFSRKVLTRGAKISLY